MRAYKSTKLIDMYMLSFFESVNFCVDGCKADSGKSHSFCGHTKKCVFRVHVIILL